MYHSSETVHRIVVTAFHGVQPSESHVIDHIDTNKRNNRLENLRWVTRLENILLNPITLSRIIFNYAIFPISISPLTVILSKISLG
ncbi:HNH endonuclease [Echinicola sp. CAU 1574]|uniref:HNH endonuclease n=2 Tax=Echinicola arenosa TaxID=2774144 RepID=A0ABR9AK60_9BACT|nr:HNH endonuclease [Echinicola arenosa]